MTQHEEFESLAALDAVGALEESEAAALHEHLASCESCRRASDEFAESAAMLALSAPTIAPPPSARANVLETVRERDESATAAEKRTPTWWLAAAAVFFLALFAWSELRNRMMRERLEETRAAARASIEESRRASAANERLSRQIAQLTSPGTRTIALTGESIAPTARARVFMNDEERTALVFFENLPVNPRDKSYELWVVRADRPEPEAAGVFDAGPDGKAQVLMKNLPENTKIKAIAVTLEPRGGGAAPQGERYLVGSL